MLKKLNWLDKYNKIYLTVWFAFIFGIGIFNGTYFLTTLYLGTFFVLTFIVKPESLYDTVFELMMVSMIFDYTLHLPGISKIYVFHVAFIMFSLMSLIKLVKEKDILKNLDVKIIKILCVFFIFIVISFAWAVNKQLALKYICIYAMTVIFIIDMLIYNIRKEQLSKTIKIIGSLFLFIILIGVIETLTGNQLPVNHSFDNSMNAPSVIAMYKSNPIAFSFNVNNYSCMLALLAPFVLFSIYKIENIMVRVIVALITTFSFGIVIITASRTGSLAMVVVFGLFFLYSLINIRKLKKANIVIMIIMVIGTILLFNFAYLIPNIKIVGENVEQIQVPTNENRLTEKVGNLKESETAGDGSINARRIIAKSILTGVFIDKNLAGYGVGNSEQYLRVKCEAVNIYSPHALIIELLGDFGVFGVALYGLLYLYLLIKSVIIAKNTKDSIAIASIVALIALAPASFGPSSITYIFLYWTVLGLIASNIQIKSRKEV